MPPMHTIGRSGKGVKAMRERIIVSGGGKLRAFDAQGLRLVMETPLEGSGALCAGRGFVLCACGAERVIYRLHAQTLLPQGVCAGGPGMRAMCLSGDGERLYVLLSGADSVLMLSGKDGAPAALARVGVNPQSMRLDDTGERLIIAGGRDGCAHLLCARTLRLLRRVEFGGFLADASCRGNRVRAMRLPCGQASAAAGKLLRFSGGLLMINPPAQRLYAGGAARGRWRLVCADALDAAAVRDTPPGGGAYSP